MVPMKTKNRPNAKDRATSVIVLGEAISSLLAAPGASERNDWESHGFPGKMHQGDGLLEARQTWRRAGPRSAAHLRPASWRDAGLFVFHRKQVTSATTHFLSRVHSLRFLQIYTYLRLIYSCVVLFYYSIVRILIFLYILLHVLFCSPKYPPPPKKKNAIMFMRWQQTLGCKPNLQQCATIHLYLKLLNNAYLILIGRELNHE